jgi:hypothetical protein
VPATAIQGNLSDRFSRWVHHCELSGIGIGADRRKSNHQRMCATGRDANWKLNATGEREGLARNTDLRDDNGCRTRICDCYVTCGRHSNTHIAKIDGTRRDSDKRLRSRHGNPRPTTGCRYHQAADRRKNKSGPQAIEAARSCGRARRGACSASESYPEECGKTLRQSGRGRQE